MAIYVHYALRPPPRLTLLLIGGLEDLVHDVFLHGDLQGGIAVAVGKRLFIGGLFRVVVLGGIGARQAADHRIEVGVGDACHEIGDQQAEEQHRDDDQHGQQSLDALFHLLFSGLGSLGDGVLRLLRLLFRIAGMGFQLLDHGAAGGFLHRFVILFLKRIAQRLQLLVQRLVGLFRRILRRVGRFADRFLRRGFFRRVCGRFDRFLRGADGFSDGRNGFCGGFFRRPGKRIREIPAQRILFSDLFAHVYPS
ncbi:MAG: hypothetical protein IKH34_09990, partial [Oscillospiraceae bacterium]|nr:hypothetical protein [Oscillospiraceae bacterium]